MTMIGNETPAPDLSHIEAWVFDLDNTLYRPRSEIFSQIDARMGAFVARLMGVDGTEARRIQKDYFVRHGTTLRGLMLHHRIDPSRFLSYVHKIDVSSLDPDPALERALARLPGRKIIHTNASRDHAGRVLERLAVDHHFDTVFDIIEADYHPKPEAHGYEKLIAKLGLAPARIAMIEDIARNLAPAAALGMTTVWVPHEEAWSSSGAEDGHVHYVADDLVLWLEGVAGARAPNPAD